MMEVEALPYGGVMSRKLDTLCNGMSRHPPALTLTRPSPAFHSFQIDRLLPDSAWTTRVLALVDVHSVLLP